MAWLDTNGLSYFWSKIKSALSEKLDKTATAKKTASIPIGQVDATSTSTVYTATVDGITELRDGVCVWLRNGVVTSESGFTININNLGAKPVYGSLSAASRSTTLFNVAYTMLFVYNSTRVDGGCWDAVYGYDSNTNTIGYQLRTNSTSLPMKSTTYRYRLLFTSADGTRYVPANNSTSTNATAKRTVCQDPIDPFGPIRYYGTTASVAADSRPGTAYLWEQYNVTLGYSFNNTGAALTLAPWTPVYIRAVPRNNGSATINPLYPYSQGIADDDSGDIYIYLGVATSATTVELAPEHPVYYRRNGKIRMWTGDNLEEVYSQLVPAATSEMSGYVLKSGGGNSNHYWGIIPKNLTTLTVAQSDSAGIYYVIEQLKIGADTSGRASMTVPFAAGEGLLTSVLNAYINDTIPVLYILGSDPYAGIRVLNFRNFYTGSLDDMTNAGAETGYTDGSYDVNILFESSSVTITLMKLN